MTIPDEAHRGGWPDMSFWSLPGKEQLRIWVDEQRGVRPPISYLTGMRPTAYGDGEATFTMPATRWLLGPTGVILGGALAMLADGPLGVALQTTLPGATPYSTAELTMSYLRPPVADGRDITASGRLVHRSRTLGLTETSVTDADGRLLAHATSRCFIFPTVELPAGIAASKPEPAEDFADAPFTRAAQGEVTPAEAWASRSGLDVLRGWIEESLPAPPIHFLTGSRPVGGGDGWASFAMPATPWLTSPLGTVEGGALVMLMDSALAAAVQTTIPAGASFAPLDITAKFLRPVQADGGELVARAEVVHRGRSIAVAQGEVRNTAGKVVLLAIGSSMVAPDRPMVAPVAPADEVARDGG